MKQLSCPIRFSRNRWPPVVSRGPPWSPVRPSPLVTGRARPWSPVAPRGPWYALPSGNRWFRVISRGPSWSPVRPSPLVTGGPRGLPWSLVRPSPLVTGGPPWSPVVPGTPSPSRNRWSPAVPRGPPWPHVRPLPLVFAVVVPVTWPKPCTDPKSARLQPVPLQLTLFWGKWKILDAKIK